jgi:hypothetical protein
MTNTTTPTTDEVTRAFFADISNSLLIWTPATPTLFHNCKGADLIDDAGTLTH